MTSWSFKYVCACTNLEPMPDASYVDINGKWDVLNEASMRAKYVPSSMAQGPGASREERHRERVSPQALIQPLPKMDVIGEGCGIDMAKTLRFSHKLAGIVVFLRTYLST